MDKRGIVLSVLIELRCRACSWSATGRLGNSPHSEKEVLGTRTGFVDVRKLFDFREEVYLLCGRFTGRRCLFTTVHVNTGWAKKVIPLVHILHCTRGITFLAHPVCCVD